VFAINKNKPVSLMVMLPKLTIYIAL